MIAWTARLHVLVVPRKSPRGAVLALHITGRLVTDTRIRCITEEVCVLYSIALVLRLVASMIYARIAYFEVVSFQLVLPLPLSPE